MKIADQPNPYNFSNPVRQRQLFVGRDRQIREIRRYLKDGLLAPQPVNLAILGERASGKTSLLNVIDTECGELGYAVARLDLNEADAKNQFAFFSKLVHALISMSFTTRCGDEPDRLGFDGPNGGIASTYEILHATLSIPDTLTFCPFAFPLFYARAALSGNIDYLNFDDTLIVRDLKLISDELKRPIAILIDECDVLTNNRTILEIFRNIFQTVERFVVALSGTPRLFDTFDDVFSPIARQYKKIDVGPYIDNAEIADAIRKPLERLSGVDPNKLFNFHNETAIREIQQVTGGSPYEVQLLCHFMFRAIQDGIAERLVLNTTVIDEVRRELGSGHSLASRPLIAKIQSLDVATLERLRPFLAGELFETLQDIRVSVALDGRGQILTMDDLERARQHLINEGLLAAKREIYTAFAGDELDRIYLRYYAQSKSVLIQRTPMPHAAVIRRNVLGHFVRIRQIRDNLLRFPLRITEDLGQDDLLRVVRGLLIDEDAPALANVSKAHLENVFTEVANALEFKDRDLTLVRIWICHDSSRLNVDIVLDLSGETDAKFRAIVEQIGQQVSAVSGSTEVVIETVPDCSLQGITRRLLANVAKENLKNLQAIWILRSLSSYGDRDVSAAIRSSRIAMSLGSDVALVNVAYMLTAQDELEEAEKLLTDFVVREAEKSLLILAEYDLAIIYAKQGRISEARSIFSRLEVDAVEHEYAYLMAIRVVEGRLQLEEIENPKFSELLTINTASLSAL